MIKTNYITVTVPPGTFHPDNFPSAGGGTSSCLFIPLMGRQNVGEGFLQQKKVDSSTDDAFSIENDPIFGPIGNRYVTMVNNIAVCALSNRKKPTELRLGYFLTKTDDDERNISKSAGLHNTKTMKTSFLLSGLKVAEVAGLTHTLCGYYDSYASQLEADDNLHNVMTNLKDMSDRILDSLRNNRLINSLETQDTHRNRCVSSLVNLKKGYDKLSDETVQSHWTVLRPVFENFLSSIQEGNYQSKSALITAMLRRLSDAEIASHLEGLSDLKTAVDRLRDAQTTFDNAQQEYQIQLQQDKTQSATDLKLEIVEYINQKLLMRLQVSCDEDPVTYGEFTNLVLSLIKSENAKVRRRKYKKETSPETLTTE